MNHEGVSAPVTLRHLYAKRARTLFQCECLLLCAEACRFNTVPNPLDFIFL